MINEKTIKIIGVATTAVGLSITLINNWVADKTMDLRIAEKVAEALANIDWKGS